MYEKPLDYFRDDLPVLIMDATYKTNKYEYDLLNGCTLTCARSVLPIFGALLISEDKESCAWVLRSLSKILNALPDVIFVDRGAGMLAALDAVPEWQRIPRFYCIWHIISRNVPDNRQHLLDAGNDALSKAKHLFSDASRAETEDRFVAIFDAIKTLYKRDTTTADGKLVRHYVKTESKIERNGTVDACFAHLLLLSVRLQAVKWLDELFDARRHWCVAFAVNFTVGVVSTQAGETLNKMIKDAISANATFSRSLASIAKVIDSAVRTARHALSEHVLSLSFRLRGTLGQLPCNNKLDDGARKLLITFTNQNVLTVGRVMLQKKLEEIYKEEVKKRERGKRKGKEREEKGSQAETEIYTHIHIHRERERGRERKREKEREM